MFKVAGTVQVFPETLHVVPAATEQPAQAATEQLAFGKEPDKIPPEQARVSWTDAQVPPQATPLEE